MLNRVDLHGFKCFELLRLPLSHLTVLSGANGSGKSSVMQALVLLHQTMREHEWSTRLMLNGSAIRLGAVADVVDKVHGQRAFQVGIVDDRRSCHWTFTGDRSELSMAVESVAISGIAHDHPASLRYLLPPDVDDSASALAGRIRGLTYITAERVGPQEVYMVEDRQVASVVGAEGQHAVSVLHLGRDERVLKELNLPEAPATRLRQVEARMRTFFPGFTMTVQQVPQVNAVTLGLRTSDDTDFHRPINVGFGLTQVLPIVIAALTVSEGHLLLIENPEVHLHPAGQALLGGFLADVARAGVQVIVETHSDHVLNGVRRSVKGGRLRPEEVAIHFFKSRNMGVPQVLSPVLDAGGNLDSWPEGFFDQFDKDMNHFAGWGS